MLILLDRDGVLNEEREGYVKTPDELVMIAGAAEAVAKLCAAGHRAIVVTNQSVVGRGIIDLAMLGRIHEKLAGEIARAGGRLTGIECCVDPPWAATERRKPGPGMLHEAMRKYGHGAGDTVMIGDSLHDMEAAAKVGCARILVRTGHGTRTQADGLPPGVLPVAVRDDLASAVATLLSESA